MKVYIVSWEDARVDGLKMNVEVPAESPEKALEDLLCKAKELDVNLDHAKNFQVCEGRI